ncbi:AlbA family DNA-binding domain-containing protein [Dactylosporangium sp. CS-033363]|uniref:AlbA family DNA-binding domain-containing protein n=1 Tax=Dactylosporangium sp. CS-033363 TaxID=3239935 RepID=UPI003D92A52C
MSTGKGLMATQFVKPDWLLYNSFSFGMDGLGAIGCCTFRPGTCSTCYSLLNVGPGRPAACQARSQATRREIHVVDHDSIDVADLAFMIAEVPTVSLRLALVSRDLDWEVAWGEVVIDRPEKTAFRTWRYASNLYIEREVPGPIAALLVGGKQEDVDGVTVLPPKTTSNALAERLPGQQRRHDLVTPWPRTEWRISHLQTPATAQQGLLVGDGPTFLSADAAVSAFFDAAASRMVSSRPAWRIVRHEQKAWIHRVKITPTKLVVRVKGSGLAGTSIELSSPTSHEQRPIGKQGTATFRLRESLPAHTILCLRTSDRWLDYRYFGDLTPGTRDDSIEWEQPGAELELLIAGGEGQHVEFKESLREESTRRKAMRTVAAFASWNSGTILVGVNDEGSVVGIPPADRDKVAVAITNAIRTNVTPEPPYAMRWIEHEGRHVLAIEVVADTQWHACGLQEPRFYVRRGASTMPATLPEIAMGFGGG